MAEIWAAELVGAGGFARPVVVKRLLPDRAHDPRFRHRLQNEARLGATLSHPNLCAVYELGEAAGEYFIAMEYLRGGSVAHLLCDHRPVPVAVAATIVAQACEGLHSAHERRSAGGTPLGFVHRDVSPPNLFVTVEGKVKVLDFGIAQSDDGSGEPTEPGRVTGKLGYVSPEHLAGGPVDRRTDVWALGVVLWELVTGRRAFGGMSGDKAAASRARRIPCLASMGIALPAVDAVLTRAICPRADRYPTAAALRSELLDALSPVPVDTLSALVWDRCGDWIRRQDRWFDHRGDRDVIGRLPLQADPPPGTPTIEDEDTEESAVPGALLAELHRQTSEVARRAGNIARLPEGTWPEPKSYGR